MSYYNIPYGTHTVLGGRPVPAPPLFRNNKIVIIIIITTRRVLKKKKTNK